MRPMSGETSKIPYVRPQLQVFGEMRLLTQTNVSKNMNDPGNGSFSMT